MKQPLNMSGVVNGSHSEFSPVARVGEGTRTPDIQIHSVKPDERKPLAANTSGESPARVARRVAQKDPKPNLDFPSTLPVPDPDLTRILDAWPALPQHIKAAVLALVQTSAPAERT
jgi:hypothetical protein